MVELKNLKNDKNFVLISLNHLGATHIAIPHLTFGGLISFQPFSGMSDPIPSLFNRAILKFQWVPGHAGVLETMSLLIPLLA